MIYIFNRTRRAHSLSWLVNDMHSHILPGIDDGCKDMQQSTMLLDRMQELGFSGCYFTPHIFKELYPNNMSTISAAFDSCTHVLAKGYAAEYMMDHAFGQLVEQQQPLLTLPGRRVLLEMSCQQPNKQLDSILFELQVCGYKPVMAHPERYIYYQKDLKAVRRLRDRGCEIQVNLLSLLGHYNREQRNAALRLKEWGLIDFLGSDVHHERQVQTLERALQRRDLFSYFKPCKIRNPELV